MRITLATPDGSVAGVVDVPDEIELENFLVLAQSEIPPLARVPTRQLGLHHSGRVLRDYQKNLKDLGVVDGDVVMVSVIRAPPTSQASSSSGNNPLGIDFASIQVPGIGQQHRVRQPMNQSLMNPDMPEAGAVRQMLLADPSRIALLRERNPQLADALINNPNEFDRIYNEQTSTRRAAEMERFRLLSRDPFDPEVQRIIEEEIRQREIESHMETAIEHMPEAFAIVTMLYIRCKVNGHEVKAFVDSGAQATIMSEACARRCNIARLIDRRFSGIARGVGVSKIAGRIHMAQLEVENDFLPLAFNVLENSGVEMLFGLDMLKRHQCIIDLQKNVLVIGTTGKTTTFLPESELPDIHHASGPASPRTEDHQLADALDRSAAEAEAASMAAAVAATNVQRQTSLTNKETSDSADQGGSAAASAETSAASTSIAASPAVDPKSLESLIAMGFRREDAVRELQRSGGDVDKAAMALIVSSLPGPPPVKKK